jgi:hypothetical protein
MTQNSEATLRAGTTRASLLSSAYSDYLDSILPLWYLVARKIMMSDNTIYCGDGLHNVRSCVRGRFMNLDAIAFLSRETSWGAVVPYRKGRLLK